MPGYPLNPQSDQTPRAGWTGREVSSSAPAGGNGPGNSQSYPRAVSPTSAPLVPSVPVAAPPVRSATTNASLTSGIFSARTWSELSYVARLLLGPESYFLGMCYGIVKNLADSILSLLGLLKMLVLAGLYEQSQHSWWDLSALPAHLAAQSAWMREQMKKSSDDVKSLVAEVVKIFKEPVKYAELFAGDMKTKGVEKWNEYLELAKRSDDLTSQFAAGEMFGEMLAEVVSTLLILPSGVGAAARLGTTAARFAKELPELFKVVEVLKGAEELKGAADAAKIAEAAKAAEAAKVAESAKALRASEAVPPWKGPTNYSSLKDPRGAGPGKKVTPLQKKKMYELNRQHNEGLLRDDVTGEVLVQPLKSMGRVTPPTNEAQVDHIHPLSQGGTNAYDNLQVISRVANRAKSDTVPSKP